MKRAHDNTFGFRLSDAEKQYLIEVVEQRSLLWNDVDANYKNLHARAKAWREVSRDMELAFQRNFDAESLQKSFKNLRDVYVRKRREFREALKRKSGSEAGILERISSWPFYSSLHFLDAVNDQGCRKSADIENIPAAESLDVLRQCTPVSRQDTPVSTPVPLRSAATISTARKLDKKQTKNSAIEHFASVLKENFENPDRFESMGQSLAAKLRELSILDAVWAEEFFVKIDEIQLGISKAIYESRKEKSK